MKKGTIYGKKVRQFFARLKRDASNVEIPDPSDPVEQLILAMLSRDASETAARRSLKRLTDTMVDLNELRVSSIDEIAACLDGHRSDAKERAERIQTTLNSVFHHHHALDLGSLHKVGRREAKAALEALDGSDPYVVASVMLWSLNGHAIPVDRQLCEALRSAELVHEDATVEEVQAFLERHIPSDEAKTFVLLTRNLSNLKPTSKRKRRATATSSSKRTSRTRPKKPRSGAKRKKKATRRKQAASK